MKYIVKFLAKLILYSVIIVLVYGVFWLICILWHFKLDPPFPKDEKYSYNDHEEWTFTDDFKYILSRMNLF